LPPLLVICHRCPIDRDRHVLAFRRGWLLGQILKNHRHRLVAEAGIPRIQERLEAIEQEAVVVPRGQCPPLVCAGLELRPEPLEGFIGHPLGESTPTYTDEAGNVGWLVLRDEQPRRSAMHGSNFHPVLPPGRLRRPRVAVNTCALGARWPP